MQQLNILIETYLTKLHMPTIHKTDVVEIVILAFLVYYILAWIKNTKAWALLKGVIVIAVFILLAAFFHMNTILWIVTNVFSIAAIAIVVVLQPELRKALEELGQKNFFSSLVSGYRVSIYSLCWLHNLGPPSSPNCVNTGVQHHTQFPKYFLG